MFKGKKGVIQRCAQTCTRGSEIYGFHWRRNSGDQWAWVIICVRSEREARSRPHLLELMANGHKQRVSTFEQGGDCVLKYHDRFCVPRVDGLKGRIMEKAHSCRYSIHLGSSNMYRDSREVYWWEGIKKGIVELVSEFPKCQQVKLEH